MPILGNLRDLPRLQDWAEADFQYAFACRNRAQAMLADSPSRQNQEHFEQSAQACIAANNGQEVWIAETPGEPKMRFAIGRRYVPDGEHVTLDELIDEGAHIIDGPNANSDLTAGEPFEAVVRELRVREIIKVQDGQILFDSFVPEDDIQSAVTCALESWDMSTEQFHRALREPEEES